MTDNRSYENPHPSNTFDPEAIPFAITVYRGTDGVSVIEIDSLGVDEASGDVDGQGVPRMRVYVNDDPVWEHPPLGDDCENTNHGHPVPWRTEDS